MSTTNIENKLIFSKFLSLPQRMKNEVADFIEFLADKYQKKRKPANEKEKVDFWQSPSLEELALYQGIEPRPDISDMFGTWPGSENDNFEEDIRSLRQTNLTGSKS